jgi:hypothetical protein
MATESLDGFIEATPALPQAKKFEGTTEKAIKVATPDLILFDEEGLPIDIMTDLIFEQIGGQEIINIARNDIINGQRISYNLISNADQINNAYNTKNIFGVPGTLESYFKNFAIRFEIHVPERGTGPNGEIVYIDKNNLDEKKKNRLVIDVTRMGVNEQVEIQVLNSGEALGDILDITEES